MKLELIQDKSAEEITKIWQEYHIHKDVIAATVPADDYNVIYEHAIKHPIFLFPIPRSQGFEFIMAQFQRNSVHFTPLICYQVRKIMIILFIKKAAALQFKKFIIKYLQYV